MAYKKEEKYSWKNEYGAAEEGTINELLLAMDTKLDTILVYVKQHDRPRI